MDFCDSRISIQYVFNENAVMQLNEVATMNFSLDVKLGEHTVPNDIWMGQLFWKKLANESYGRENSSMCKISSQSNVKFNYWPEILFMQLTRKSVLNYVCKYPLFYIEFITFSHESNLLLLQFKSRRTEKSRLETRKSNNFQKISKKNVLLKNHAKIFN